MVGTDGSATATQAVREAVDLASAVGAKVELVCAYEPVPEQRLAEERRDAPEDLQWAIGPREDVDTTLNAAAGRSPTAEPPARRAVPPPLVREPGPRPGHEERHEASRASRLTNRLRGDRSRGADR